MNPMKILLVDDSKSARYALRLQLQRFGIEVEALDSAEAALERIREAPPDAVFMDHTMPGMNGFEALEILKTTPATAQIPVVMCTSNEDPEFIAQARRKGAFSILSKSSAADKLPDLLEELKRGGAPGTPAVPEPVQGATELARLARLEAERLLAERLDGRLRQEIVAEAAAKAEQALAGRVESLAQQLSAEAAMEASQDVEARLGAHAERVGAEAARRADAALSARMDVEAERLQGRFAQVQNEQAQRTAQRLASELMPQLVRKELVDQRQEIAHLVQELLDSALEGLMQDPAFLRRLSDSMASAATSRAQEAARSEVQRLSDSVSSARAAEVAEAMMQAVRTAGRRMYLLAGIAAAVGILSAAAVYLALA
jgi:CheY-like chemotaxis protein